MAAFGVAEVDRVAKDMYHTTDPLRAEDVDRKINFFALTSEGESRRESLGRAHTRHCQLSCYPAAVAV
ncbi:hypothetical protein [Pyrobaculum calidifontis]|uniref:hypothetical protein n=1 Tax=Pyrobaculum calidifontis TaxID=181486 RepID=UPI000324B645|nr:hypothetical protein [Pyrobaculum calidifontis]